MKEVYVVLSDTGTWLSRLIRIYTKKRLNHASIAFDEELIEMYSFGRKSKGNPFVGGFVREDARKGLFKNAECEIFKFEVSVSDYGRMRDRILEVRNASETYSYNFLGLFGVVAQKKWERKYKFFCSQFVATILMESKEIKLEQQPCLTTPFHLTQIEQLECIYSGKLRDYIEPNFGEEKANDFLAI